LTTDDELLIEGGGYAGLATAPTLRKTGKKILVFDARSRLGGPVLICQCSGRQYVDPGTVRVELTCKQSIISFLAANFGEEASSPMMYIDQGWSEEECNRGGYTGIMEPQTRTRPGEELRVPVGDIHFPGARHLRKGMAIWKEPFYLEKELCGKFWKVFNL
jgi:monoamine oxidase